MAKSERALAAAKSKRMAARERAKSRAKKAAARIFADVQRRGDEAVLYHEGRFNKAAKKTLRLSESDIKRAYNKVSKKEMAALRAARAALSATEYATMSLLKKKTTSSGGARVTRTFEPLPSAGCYVPGGLARYPSSAIMCIVPARIAGVRRIAVASPPGPDGEIDPLTVVAADMCGAHEIYRMGGAQAIAALACGTVSIHGVAKLVGPGGAIVAEAKRLASQVTAIDMVAGPTELGIIADSASDPVCVALDMVSQAEHGSDSMCYVITDSPELERGVREALAKILPKIKRKKIIGASMRDYGFIMMCESRRQMAHIADSLAPEHLQIMAKNPEALAAKITSPGIILLGKNTPSAASDYILGSNHVLPTGRSGVSRGSLSVLDFVKLGTRVTCTRAALSRASAHIRVLAEAEGLYNHYEAVGGRL